MLQLAQPILFSEGPDAQHPRTAGKCDLSPVLTTLTVGPARSARPSDTGGDLIEMFQTINNLICIIISRKLLWYKYM